MYDQCMGFSITKSEPSVIFCSEFIVETFMVTFLFSVWYMFLSVFHGCMGTLGQERADIMLTRVFGE